MVDLLKIVKKKTLLNEVLYYVLNAGLVILLFILSQTIQSPILAIVIVLLSKWRALAVRPRFWWTNIQANIVDVIVGVSIVGLMYLPKVSLLAQLMLAIGYGLWLMVLKPLSKQGPMIVQALVAIILGVTALYAVSYEWPVLVVVLVMAIIGYSTARHVLYTYEEDQIVFLSAIFGLIFAEIGWLAYYWAYSYGLSSTSALRLPQITIIATLLSLLIGRTYHSWTTNKRIVVGELTALLLFVWLLIVVVLVFFNSVTV